MNAQELQNPEKVSTIWVKNLNKFCEQNEQYRIGDDWYEE